MKYSLLQNVFREPCIARCEGLIKFRWVGIQGTIALRVDNSNRNKNLIRLHADRLLSGGDLREETKKQST